MLAVAAAVVSAGIILFCVDAEIKNAINYHIWLANYVIINLSRIENNKEGDETVEDTGEADKKGIKAKPGNKPYKNGKEANKQAQKQGYKDAHELKKDYAGKEDMSQYDMKYDTKTGEIYLEGKDGKIQIPAGLKHIP